MEYTLDALIREVDRLAGVYGVRPGSFVRRLDRALGWPVLEAWRTGEKVPRDATIETLCAKVEIEARREWSWQGIESSDRAHLFDQRGVAACGNPDIRPNGPAPEKRCKRCQSYHRNA